MSELLQSFFSRLVGGMCVPVLVLFFFSFVGWKGVRGGWRLWSWLAACLTATFLWRIMWTASSGGRSDRYYMLLGVVCLLLIVPGARGIMQLSRWLRLDRWLKIPAALWWVAFLIAIPAVNLGKAFSSPDNKTFLPIAVDVAEEFARRQKPARSVLLDATSEFQRLEYFRDSPLPIRQSPKLRLDSMPGYGKAFLPGWVDASARYDRIMLFVRQGKEREADAYLRRNFPIETIADYPFRKFYYTLYAMDPAQVYTAEELAFLRRHSGESLEFVFSPQQEMELPFEQIFPLSNLAEWNVGVEGYYGVRDDRAWRWIPAPGGKETHADFQLTFTLWNRRNLPVAARTVTMRAGAAAPLPPPGKLESLSPGTPDAEPAEPANESGLPCSGARRVMFFGIGLTRLEGLKAALPPGIEPVQTRGGDASENDRFAHTFKMLSMEAETNPYRLDGELSLIAGELDTVVLLLGQQELMRFGAAELLWDFQIDDLFGAIGRTVRDLRAVRPELRIVLGTLPAPRGGRIYVHESQGLDFYKQAARRFNRRLRAEFGRREAENIFILPLDYALTAADIRPDNALELSPAGKTRLLQAVGTFFRERN